MTGPACGRSQGAALVGSPVQGRRLVGRLGLRRRRVGFATGLDMGLWKAAVGLGSPVEIVRCGVPAAARRARLSGRRHVGVLVMGRSVRNICHSASVGSLVEVQALVSGAVAASVLWVALAGLAGRKSRPWWAAAASVL